MSHAISQSNKAALLEILKGLRIMDDIFMNEFVKRDKGNEYRAQRDPESVHRS